MPENFWLFIPLVALQLILMAFALIDLLRRKPRGMVIWAIVIVLFSILGPVLYFALGRKSSPDED